MRKQKCVYVGFRIFILHSSAFTFYIHHQNTQVHLLQVGNKKYPDDENEMTWSIESASFFSFHLLNQMLGSF